MAVTLVDAIFLGIPIISIVVAWIATHYRVLHEDYLYAVIIFVPILSVVIYPNF